ITHDAAKPVLWGRVDGATALFARATAAGSEVVLADGGGEHVLSGATETAGGPGDVRDGWAAWTTGGPAGTRLWTRSPAGDVRQTGMGLAQFTWRLGWQGKVLMFSGYNAYLARPGGGATQIGPEPMRWDWPRDQLYVTWSGDVYRVDQP
ncbi:MAG: hypothetical protein JO306_05655, partial [Gemmatimonadetes bacterium]|nr:hypothetical protein [Gemmatimonadota bacterium]